MARGGEERDRGGRDEAVGLGSYQGVIRSYGGEEVGRGGGIGCVITPLRSLPPFPLLPCPPRPLTTTRTDTLLPPHSPCRYLQSYFLIHPPVAGDGSNLAHAMMIMWQSSVDAPGMKGAGGGRGGA